MFFRGIIFLALAPAVHAQLADSVAAPSGGGSALPLSAGQRIVWITSTTVGPKNIAAGVFVAGIQTGRNEPEAYGPHWDGYGKRYGARLIAGGTSNALEAGFGSLWGEDPRYFRAAEQPLKARLGHVVKMAFVTHNSLGDPQPAYARYLAVPGGILVTNTWRPNSPSTVRHVSYQIGISFLSRMAGNAFSEFLPDLGKLRSRTGNNLWSDDSNQ